jgi:uncharacterized protein YndB with AHSA1/START domain
MATLVFLKPTRANFHLDPTERELLALSDHFAWMSGLVLRGQVTIAGPCQDGTLGIALFAHDDPTTVDGIMSQDPCVAQGIMTFETKAFRTSLFGTGTARDWRGFTQAIHISASVTDVWGMLSSCAGLERWFLRRAEATTTQGTPLTPERAFESGLKLKMTWTCAGTPDDRGARHPVETTEENTILAVEPAQRLRIGWYEDRGWVDIRVAPHTKGRVTVELQQHMNATGDFALLESAYIGCKEGWAFFLTNLMNVAQGGADLRDLAPDRKDLVNL